MLWVLLDQKSFLALTSVTVLRQYLSCCSYSLVHSCYMTMALLPCSPGPHMIISHYLQSAQSAALQCPTAAGRMGKL